MRTVDPAEGSVEGAEWRVSCLSGDLHHETVGKADLLVLSTLRHRRLDHLSVLNTQLVVVQQHFDGNGDGSGGAPVDGFQDPCRLRDRPTTIATDASRLRNQPNPRRRPTGRRDQRPNDRAIYSRRIFSIGRPLASSSTSLSRYRIFRISGSSISSMRTPQTTPVILPALG